MEPKEKTESLASRNGSLEERVPKAFTEHFPDARSTQLSGSVFAEKIEQGKKTKNQLELRKNADRFLDGSGNFTRNIVFFERCLY